MSSTEKTDPAKVIPVDIMNQLRSEMEQMKQIKDDSIRKSMSIMQNQFARNNDAIEDHLKEVSQRHKQDVEAKVQHYNDIVKSLKEQIVSKENVIDELKGRLDECRTARKEALEELAETRKCYSSRVKELETCIAESKEKLVLLERERERRKSEAVKIQGLESNLGTVRNENLELENNVERLDHEVKQQRVTIEKLEAAKQALEVSVQSLEQENNLLNGKLETCMNICKSHVDSNDSVKKVLDDQIAKLQEDLEETKNLLVLEELRYRNLDKEMQQMQTDNGLLKVDVRIEQIYTRDLQSKLGIKEEECQSLEEKVAALDATNCELTSKITVMQNEVVSLKSQLEARNQERSGLLKLQETVNEQKVCLESENETLRHDLAVLKVQAKENETLNRIIASKDELISEKGEIIEKKNRKIKSLENSLEILRDTAAYLDTQLKEFDSYVGKKVAELGDAERVKELFESENKDIREQLRKCRIELNEAKSLKTFTEKRLELTESTLKSQTECKETEFQDLAMKLNVATRRNEELSEEMSSLMTQNSALEGEKFELRKQVESTKCEVERLQKEVSLLVKAVVDMKDENLSLQATHQETLKKAESFKEQLEMITEMYQQLESVKQTSDIKYNTTIEQQEKLILYLQEQLAVYQDKKKKKGTLFTPKRTEKEVFTPAKVVTPLRRPEPVVTPASHTAPQTSLEEELRSVEKLEKKQQQLLGLRNILNQDLEKKRAKHGLDEGRPFGTPSSNRQLETFPTFFPVSRKTPTLPTPKKEESVLLKEKCNTVGGNRSGLATKQHKLRNVRSEKTDRCMVCRDPIYKNTVVSFCEVCNYRFHLTCADKRSQSCPTKAVAFDDGPVRGWVKIRTEAMSSADKRYMRIEDGVLKVFLTENPRERPQESFSLNERTTVFFRIEKKDQRPTTNKNEIALAMKVSFNTEEGKTNVIYMFHRNSSQKRYWIRGIQQHSKVRYLSDDTLSSDASFMSDEDKENSCIRMTEKVLLVDHRKERMYANCVHWLAQSEVYLIGCDDGLYSLKSIGGKPVKIQGPQAIYQIGILNAAKTVVFIEGAKRALTTVDIGLLQTCAEAAEISAPKFTSCLTKDTKDCYIFDSRSTSTRDTIVAAASNNCLLVCKWQSGVEGLTVIKQISVKDNITTLLMTENSVLFGNHNVFEVDTKTWQLEEFLDMSDESVYYVKIINESHGSYPVAILDVSESLGPTRGSSDREYLICFQDIGIFVDDFGRRSREEDVLWSQVPVAFEYSHPYLFIFHFTTIEIQKLVKTSYTRMIVQSDSKAGQGPKRSIVKSQTITPTSRFFQVTSKGCPHYVGKGDAPNAVVFTVGDSNNSKVMQLTAS